MADQTKPEKKRGRPPKPGGAVPPAKRQAAYREKKLMEGIEISIFLTHNQAEILRQTSRKKGKTQSEVLGGLLENITNEQK